MHQRNRFPLILLDGIPLAFPHYLVNVIKTSKDKHESFMVKSGKASPLCVHGLQICAHIQIIIGVKRDLSKKGAFGRERGFVGDQVVQTSKNYHVLIGQVNSSGESEERTVSLGVCGSPEVIVNVVLPYLLGKPADNLYFPSHCLAIW